MSDGYFLNGAAESCAIFEALQEFSQECGPKEPVEAKSEIPASPAPIERPALPRRRLDVPVWTYFLQAGDVIKIGRSTNPHSRVNHLATATHMETVLLAYVPQEFASESQLHAEFDDLRVRREWFRAEPVLLDRIAELRELWEREYRTFQPTFRGMPPLPNDAIGQLAVLARVHYRLHPTMRAHMETLREQLVHLKRAKSKADAELVRPRIAEMTAAIERIKRDGDVIMPPMRPWREIAARLGLGQA